MSKPGADPSSGISSEDVLIPSERHPACRRREARPGSGMERENLAGDAKGKGASGSNREAKSTDAPERGGLPRTSEEAAVMVVERRGWVIAADLGQSVLREEPFVNGRRQTSCDDTSRMSREAQVRICERLGVKFPGPTRQARSPRPDPKGLLSRQVSPHLRTTLRGGYPRPCEAGCCPLGRPDGRTNSPMTARMTFLAAENRI